MFKKILGKLSGGATQRGEVLSNGTILSDEEFEKIGTEDDPMRDYEAAFERNFEAMEAEQRGDMKRAIELYESCVAEEYVQIHPYERLATLYEQRKDYEEALRILQAFIGLAKSGTMPRGAQHSASRKLPEIESRTTRLRKMADNTD